MKEFIVLIYVYGMPVLKLSPEKQQKHIEKVGKFIASLANNGRLKNAQPFEPRGISITGIQGVFQQTELNAGEKDIVGFYHVVANDVEEVSALIRTDPRFEDTDWRVDIWPILELQQINEAVKNH